MESSGGASQFPGSQYCRRIVSIVPTATVKDGDYLRTEQQVSGSPSYGGISQISNLDALYAQMQNMSIDPWSNNVIRHVRQQTKPNQRFDIWMNNVMQPMAHGQRYDPNRRTDIGSNMYNYVANEPELDEDNRFLQAMSIVPFIMIDNSESKTYILDNLIRACTDLKLDLLAGTMLSDPRSFLEAAQGTRRSSSICSIIRKLKHSPKAHKITSIIAPEFILVGTNYGVKKVIKECLNTFGNAPNQVIFDQAIRHFRAISVYKDGSKLIQEDILSRISGASRVTFLMELARASGFLVQDPFGNYIVSYVLSLNHQEINGIIYTTLTDRIVFLSRLISSSHVVERVIESSETGLRLVVDEITETPDTLVGLAMHRLGNYVVQKVLRCSNRRKLGPLYNALSTLLRENEEQLRQSHAGSCVLSTIEELEKDQP